MVGSLIRCLLLACTILFTGGCGARIAPATQPTRVARPLAARVPDVEVNLLAMGDWGTGSARQRVVATTLANYIGRAAKRFDGMLLAGDNFYVRLRGTDDPQWRTMFEELYDPWAFSFPFFPSLGNHDYQDGKDAIELAYAAKNPESRWKFPARWYRVDLPADQPLVTLLMLDSNKGLLGEQRWGQEMQWLREELAKPRRAKWLVCAAHHPLYSNGDHGDNGVLQREWGPLFDEYGVDFYVCGHDHDLQHLQFKEHWPSFVLVGGGGASVRAMRIDRRGPFSQSINGFAHLRFTPDHAELRLISRDGKTLHTARRKDDGTVQVITTEGTEPAQPRTIKSITRPDLTGPTTTRATTRQVED
jgi:hypothetical protein